MEHQCLHLIIAPLLQQPKCELTPHEHFMYIRFLWSSLTHMDNRYGKSLNRLLKVCHVPATSTVLPAFFSSFFGAAINSTNEANKAAGTRC